MPTPFPGMDPYLERPALWQNVHTRLIVAIADDLAPRLAPRYFVSVEERMYLLEPTDLSLLGRPDLAVANRTQLQEARGAYGADVDGGMVVTLPPPLDAVTETYLTIVDVDSEHVIAAIELLSPTNKLPGKGREAYLDKRTAMLESSTHLVEIDLLRAGGPMPLRDPPPPSDYRLLLSRAERRPAATLVPFSVRQPIPSFRIPLQPGDDEPVLHLNGLLHSLYDRAAYSLRLKYGEAPTPPLTGADAAWADALLRDAGLRRPQ